MARASRFDFGDVVLVPFRFTDQSGPKKRLAIAAPDAVPGCGPRAGCSVPAGARKLPE
jgi:hypothetical protein